MRGEEARVKPHELFFDLVFVLALTQCTALMLPAATELPALASLALVTALFVGLIVYETIRFSELRQKLRHELAT